MKYCPKCGTQNPDEGKFCKGCGYSFDTVGNPISSPTTLQQSDTTSAKEQASTQPRKKRKSLWFIIPLCLIILAELCYIGFQSYEYNRTEKKIAAFNHLPIAMTPNVVHDTIVNFKIDTIYVMIDNANDQIEGTSKNIITVSSTSPVEPMPSVIKQHLVNKSFGGRTINNTAEIKELKIDKGVKKAESLTFRVEFNIGDSEFRTHADLKYKLVSGRWELSDVIERFTEGILDKKNH